LLGFRMSLTSPEPGCDRSSDGDWGLKGRTLGFLLAGISLLALGSRLLGALAHTSMEGDEFVYVRMAQELVGASPGGVPLAQPLLFPYLLAGMQALVGDWEWAGRLIGVLAGALMVPALAAFGRAVLGSWTPGLMAALLVTLYPLNLDLGSRVMTEPLYHLLLVLACWQVWRVLQANDSGRFGQSALAGVAVAAACLSRREGRIYLGILALILLLELARTRGWRQALLSCGTFAATALALIMGSDLLVEQPRRTPHMTLALASLARTGRTLVLPLLAPILLVVFAPRRSDDARRLGFLGAMLLALPVLAIFPDPGRKATALMPFLGLLAAEGALRWGQHHRNRAIGAGLLVAVLAWFLLQGVSAPMMPHFVPPWTDRAEDRAAGQWLATRLDPGEAVCAWDHAPPYYASAVWWRPSSKQGSSLASLVAACRERGIRYLVVDRRSPCRALPVAGPLGEDPRSRPGLRLVAVFPLELSALNEFLSAPLAHRGLRPNERAVVYRVEDPGTEEGISNQDNLGGRQARRFGEGRSSSLKVGFREHRQPFPGPSAAALPQAGL